MFFFKLKKKKNLQSLIWILMRGLLCVRKADGAIFTCLILSAICRPFLFSSSSSALFQDDGDALTTADAGRTHGVLSSPAPVEMNGSYYSKQLSKQSRGLLCHPPGIGHLSSWTRWAVMRVPEAPRGWPTAIAPPLTLLFSGSRPRALATARYWGANASFTWKMYV